jgi:arginine N-succinyltransferase
MLIVRRVFENDLEPLFELIQRSEYGLTTLKISKDVLAARIESSAFAFSQKSEKPAGQPYVFVMEDLTHGKIVGTCSIYSKVGGFEPFYSYEIKKSVHQSEELGVHKEIDVLHLRDEHDGPSEIGSLFLSPDYWGSGHGRLLSMSRFLFVAEFINRFETEMIAEMRGVVGADGISPLWSAIGSHFFQIDFPKAETMSSLSKKFIADLMPKHPIYIPLLPEPAQAVIGQVHENTRPALSVLEKEGFEFRELVDIFDGGPTIHCETKQIRAVRESRRGVVTKIVSQVESGSQQLISNTRLDYRACLGETDWHSPSDETTTEAMAEAMAEVTIDEVTALRLQLKVGDTLRAVNLKRQPITV